MPGAGATRSVGAAIAAAPRPEPRSTRGRRTRAALVEAARAVFERDGFLDARIADITREAGVAVGSFYTHFSGREEIFAAVLAEVQEDMLQPTSHALLEDDPLAVIDAANRSYLSAYRRNARMNGLMEQVAAIDETFMALRQRRAEVFVRRNARGIRRLQELGLADRELDAAVAADALSHMVSRMANHVFVHGRPVPFEKLVWTANRLWANALRIPIDERDAQ
jgi:AcrR family transcriptional regulator